MRLFNRNNSDNNIPTEIREYNQAERRQRVGIAWTLAFVTLVVTVLLALGLFFGGRWLYRSIFDNDKATPIVQEGTTVENSETSESKEAESSNEETASELPGSSEESTTPSRRKSRRTPNTGPLPSTGPSEPEL
jgi:hypothetical protein